MKCTAGKTNPITKLDAPTPNTPERRALLGKDENDRQSGRAMLGAPISARRENATERHLPAFLTSQSDGVTLAIKLQPRASKNENGDAHGAELRIKVTAPPVDAAANEALLRLLTDTLDCPRGKVELIRGKTARQKVVKIYGITAADVLKSLTRC